MPQRLFAIGDIHGCSTALKTLIDAIDPRPDDALIILGDVIDWGPDSRGAVQQLIELAGRCVLVLVLGNHEEMLFHARGGQNELLCWLKLGGQQTLDSYGVMDPKDIPRDHVEFLRGGCDFYETETHIFVHANYWPNRSMREQSNLSLRWEHIEPARAARHYSGKTVIAGHTPQENGQVLDLGFLKVIDTDASRAGWLTALEVNCGAIQQANERGETRGEN